MVIIDIDVGTTVLSIVRGHLLVYACYFLTVESFLFGILRRWMCTVSLVYFMDLTHFLRVLWRIKGNLFIYWKSVLYCVHFEVIYRDIFGIIDAINWINSLPCWINTQGGFHINIQVGVFYHLVIYWLVL